MKTQLNVRLEESLKEKFDEVARNQGRSSSDVVRDLISNYVQEHDLEGYIDELWNRIDEDLESRGYSTGDVDEMVQQVREGTS